MASPGPTSAVADDVARSEGGVRQGDANGTDTQGRNVIPFPPSPPGSPSIADSPDATSPRRDGGRHSLTSFDAQQRGQEIKAAVEDCVRALLPHGEFFIHGWLFIFVNQWNKHQERIVLLTSSAYYRVKYDFNSKKVEHSQSIVLSEVTRIERGFIRTEALGAVVRKKPESELRFGTRIYHSQGRDASVSPFSKEQIYRTFTTNVKGVAGRKLVDEFVNCLSEARKRVFSPENIVVDTEIVLPDPLPFMSSLHNKLQWGRWHKDKNDHD